MIQAETYILSSHLTGDLIQHLRYLEGIEECNCDSEFPTGDCPKCSAKDLADRIEKEITL